MGNGEALFGVVEHNQVSRGGYFGHETLALGSQGLGSSWKEREGQREGGEEREGQRKPTRLPASSGIFSRHNHGTLGSTKYQEITLTHPGKLVNGRKSVSGFYLHWCSHSCVSSCQFPGVGWVLWVPPSSPLSPFGYGMHSCQVDDQ